MSGYVPQGQLWQSVDERQLQYLRKIHEILYSLKHHQEKISSAQVTEMSVIISILGKMLVKLEQLEKRCINNGNTLANG